MSEEEILFLAEQVALGRFVYSKRDIRTQPDGPMGPSKWYSQWQRVISVRYDEDEGEPIAVHEDGTYNALWVCETSVFEIFDKRIEFPVEGTFEPMPETARNLEI
jgi:hypothetical protein